MQQLGLILSSPFFFAFNELSGSRVEEGNENLLEDGRHRPIELPNLIYISQFIVK